jgi:CRISPR-associated protein Cas1
MTVAGQKNHYNVKLLKGYGVSINLKNNRLCLKGGRDPFTGEQETEEWFVSQIPYERIVISGKGYLSTEAVKLLTDNNINIILTDTYGNLITAMHKVMSSPTATSDRMAQYDAFRNPEKVAFLQKQFLKAKLESQIQLLQSVHRPEVQEAIDGLAAHISRIEAAKDKRDLLTIESRAGYLYFRNYAKLFDKKKYGFVSRSGGGIRTRNRYASDPIYGLLNYGYTVLAGEIAKHINSLGLDPYYGFFHVTHNSFQALVYDLIEPFRWLVEYAVYKIASDTNHSHRISKDDYAWTREGRIVLDDDLIRRFLELLERKFQSERPYKFKHGIKRRDGLSMCQEITIAKIIVQNLADYCILE